jgi:molecular chaperone GrpE (heat shock protein)
MRRRVMEFSKYDHVLRLQREIDQLKANAEGHRICEENMDAEVERLNDELETMRAQLKDCVGSSGYEVMSWLTKRAQRAEAEVERLRAIRDLADKACLAYGKSKGRVIPEMERLGRALEGSDDVSD